MTFDDLLNQNPALRRLRSLNADLLRSMFARQRGECTWCGKPVGKGRQTWCSKQCTDGFLHRCSPGHQQAFIIQRDNEICQICGRDLAKAKRIYEHFRRHMRSAGLITDYMAWRDRDVILLDVQQALGFGRGGWYQIDHKTPVCEGGGLCDTDGVRLICGRCHHEETTALQARLSKKRKKKK